jgi:hypothetical protein
MCSYRSAELLMGTIILLTVQEERTSFVVRSHALQQGESVADSV